jgi:hypoxanthine phosphoribosyltransferase
VYELTKPGYDFGRMNADIARILISRDRIARRVQELAVDIGRTYAGDAEAGLTLVTILSGSLVFLADLIRCLPLRMRIGLITVSSYRGTKATPATILQQLNTEVTNRHILVVDDILDTGGTLRLVRERLAAAGPRSIRTCVLLRKPSKAPPDVAADFVGFDIEDVFVVGYGLDYNDHYRNLPDIAVLREEVYAA